MKHIVKNIYAWLAVVTVGLVGTTFTSCTDDMAPEHYYTWNGKMMSDYLNADDNLSEFAAIVSRATGSTRGVNIMDLLGTYGDYTCFAPTNKAVDTYLSENGYSSVEEIPVDICDTIARTHLINGRVYSTADFAELLGDKISADVNKVNMNGRYLSLEYVDNVASYKLSGTGVILHANDSVDNGIVHTVNAVLSPSNATVPDLLAEDERVTLFSEALVVTGLADYMANRIKDDTWNYYAEEYEPYHGKIVYSGAQNNWCDIPEERKFKFTVFACPDDILAANPYNITDLESFYNYARNIYGGPEFDKDMDFKDKANPLHRLIAYHCLPFAQSYDHYTTICTIRYNETKAFINPTEWYSTMDTIPYNGLDEVPPLATIKMTRIKSAREIRMYPPAIEEDLYLNRSDNNRSTVHNPGIHVQRPTSGHVQEARNGAYFLIDGLADYSQETQDEIFNTRIRFDLLDCFPEMISNDLRNYEETHTSTKSDDPKSPARNYILPQGYIDGVKVNSDGIFLYQGARNYYWSYEGDEFNLASDVNHYDLEFYLPSVPSGTYQLRLGLAAMPSRGICQFYLDDVPYGIPFDERNEGLISRIGWVAPSQLEAMSQEDREAAKKNMHNNNWYHGPKGIFNTPSGGYKDGKDALGHSGGTFYEHETTLRYVLYTGPLSENKRHKVRIKSIWAVGTALIMFDYMELVPKSVYGVEGEGKAEDEY